MNWVNSVPQTAATTFAFSSFFSLILCLSAMAEATADCQITELRSLNRDDLSLARQMVDDWLGGGEN